MLTLEEIREKLEGYRNMQKLARDMGGVTGAYLNAIRIGTKINPSYNMVKKLSDYFKVDKK